LGAGAAMGGLLEVVVVLVGAEAGVGGVASLSVGGLTKKAGGSWDMEELLTLDALSMVAVGFGFGDEVALCETKGLEGFEVVGLLLMRETKMGVGANDTPYNE
jgi:hypothetical protein